MPSVGRNVPRREGPDKLTGRARYIDDLDFPGGLFGVTCRSSVPHGVIRKIYFDPAFPWAECVVVTAADIPGDNQVVLFEADQPLLAPGIVRHRMEPIALVAHPLREKAYEALNHIRVEYEELPSALSIEESLARKAVLYGTDNVMRRYEIRRGDVDAALDSADVVVEGVYRVPHQEQAYIENNGVAAYEDENGVLTIVGSLQCPYFIVKALKPILKRTEENLRVIQAVTGGAFGGKEEYPDMIAGHAALLALKAKRPVKIIYDRTEDMMSTTKRHPAVVRHRTGLTRDGKLVAQDIDVVMDAGAYVTISPVVLSRGVLHATGPYECPNARLTARAVATNTPPNGAFRGFGAPQTLFAAELHWERISRALGIDPLTLRRRNILKKGSVMATGQVLRESVSAETVLERAVRKSGYLRKRQAFDAWNREAARPTWKGIGLALVHHGPGFTGNGEVVLASRVAVTLTPSGDVRVEVANTEMGQGPTTTLAQIVADTLDLPFERVRVQNPDTHRVPNSGPTVASRTCMVVGGLLAAAARKLQAAVQAETGRWPKTKAGLAAAARRLSQDGGDVRFTADFQKPADIHFDDQTYQGDAYGTYGFACAVTELEVDKTTFEVKVRRFTTSVDVGKAIHPLIVEGQIMGGALQGLGYGLLENPVYDRGAMLNAQFTNYIIPTAADAPPMEVDIVEDPYSRGPFGAKGVGEIPLNSPAPSAAAAVHHATGLLVSDLPVLPEKIEKAHHEREQRA